MEATTCMCTGYWVCVVSMLIGTDLYSHDKEGSLSAVLQQDNTQTAKRSRKNTHLP